MTVSRTFKVSGLATAAAILALVTVGSGSGDSFVKVFAILTLVVAGSTFAVSALRHLIRGLLWRVGSRLLVSYLLIGVVPIPFVTGFLVAAGVIVCGQLAGRRAEAALLARYRLLASTAQELAAGTRLVGVDQRRLLFERLRDERKDELPGLVLGSLAGDTVEVEGGLPAGSLTPPFGSGQDLSLVRDRDTLYLAAAPASGSFALLLPVGEALAARLQRDTNLGIGFSTSISRPLKRSHPEPKPPGSLKIGIQTGDEDVSFRSLTPATSSPSASSSGWIDREWVRWLLPIDRKVRVWSTGAEASEGRFILSIRSSVGRELRELFGSAKIGARSGSETGTVVLAVMKGLGFFTVSVYLLALLVAGLLVLRIARAARRLSVGFAEIDKGNFGHRATLKGRDQLAELVESFNEMASHLQSSVSEQASHEALERELELARNLQRRLLPPADFAFPGLEIAVDFSPASAIGGDFYHFVPEPPDRLTVVLADVSGHGLSTGIVMASAKASLSALATTGTDAVAIMGRLDEEIRRTTDRRTFVTLAHLRFLFDEGKVQFTNAGHLYPYRVEPLGNVSTLANPARPLGLTLPATFRTVDGPLVPGDLWVITSDGIVEATSPSGEQFGFPRLEAILARGAGGSAAATRDRVLAAWREFTGGDMPEDDRTLLVLKVLVREAR